MAIAPSHTEAPVLPVLMCGHNQDNTDNTGVTVRLRAAVAVVVVAKSGSPVGTSWFKQYLLFADIQSCGFNIQKDRKDRKL